MQKFLNNFNTTFIASVKDTAVTGTPATEMDYGVLRISDGAAGVLTNPTGGDFYVLTAYKKSGTAETNIEIMKVTAVDNATVNECRITVLRAQEGTTAKAYVSGDYISLRLTAGGTGAFAQTTELTKASVGLGNVDNTSDVSKPVSTLQAAAIGLKLDASAAYAHPVNHPASIITQDASNRFVTDAEKTAWNAKQSAGNYATGGGTASGTNTGDQDLSGKQNVLVSGTNIKTVGGVSLLGSGDIAAGGAVANYPYDSRATLRTLSPANGDAAIVKDLGLFVWESASTEPDDDESAFATASGVWLLQAAAWDLIDAWQDPDQQALADDDEDEPLRFASSFASKVIHQTYTNTVSSVGANTTTTQVVTVTGAAVGDAVVVTRSGTAASKPEGVVYGVVTADSTVTVYYANPTNAVANNYLTTGNWRVTVIKS